MNPLLLLGFMLKASLFSFSGMGNLPSLHADLLARAWADDRQFAEALAVGQISPGPTGLWVVSLGFLVDGLRGALLSLIAIILPPLLVLLVEKIYRRLSHLPAVDGFVHGLSLGVVGIFAVVLIQLLRGGPMNARTGFFVLAGMALAAIPRFPVSLIIALAAVAGLLLR